MQSQAASERSLDQWHGSAWFGSLFGSTLWMGIAAGTALLENELLAGGVALGACAIANTVGIALWWKRAESNAYRSLQTLIWVLAIVTIVTIVTFDRTDAYLGLSGLASTTRFQMYAVLLVFPALSVMFHVRHRAARRSS